MGRARSETVVELDPDEAFDLWTDVSRWRTFVDGFAHVERVDDEWPAPGARLVWRSLPNGRGVVTEKVRASARGVELVTDVVEERMTARQIVSFAPAEDPDVTGTAVAVELHYEVQNRGPLGRVVDFLFINRAQRDALTRTLRRFRIEAAEEAAL